MHATNEIARPSTVLIIPFYLRIRQVHVKFITIKQSFIRATRAYQIGAHYYKTIHVTLSYPRVMFMFNYYQRHMRRLSKCHYIRTYNVSRSFILQFNDLQTFTETMPVYERSPRRAINDI